MAFVVRFALALVVSLGLALAPLGVAIAQQTIPLPLAGVAGSPASGTASVAVEGEAASVGVVLSSLTPGAVYAVNLQTGTCAAPSASFGRLGSLTADATGNGRLVASSVTASAAGTEVALTPGLLLDGDHILVVTGVDAVACGSIPATPGQLPATGGMPLASAAGVLGTLGLSTLLLGWRLRRR